MKFFYLTNATYFEQIFFYNENFHFQICYIHIKPIFSKSENIQLGQKQISFKKFLKIFHFR